MTFKMYVNMFSNSKMSEFHPRERGGGGQPFSKTSEINKSLNYPIGGRGESSLIGILSKFLCFLLVMDPLTLFFQKQTPVGPT